MVFVIYLGDKYFQKVWADLILHKAKTPQPTNQNNFLNSLTLLYPGYLTKAFYTGGVKGRENAPQSNVLTKYGGETNLAYR